MTNEQEMVIRVKFQDTYKAVANYIKNGLGVTRETVFGYIEKFTKQSIEDYFCERPEFVRDIAKSIVLENMNKVLPAAWSRSGVQKFIADTMDAELRAMIKAELDARVKVEIKATEGSTQ
jgi:hypothetical protein